MTWAEIVIEGKGTNQGRAGRDGRQKQGRREDARQGWGWTVRCGWKTALTVVMELDGVVQRMARFQQLYGLNDLGSEFSPRTKVITKYIT